MPFQRPTLTDLRQSAAADVTANLPGGDGLLRFSNLQIVCEVTAGFANLQYGYLDWISQQSVPWSATDEFLEGWGALKGAYRGAATAASGTATFTGTNGITILTGTSFTRSDGETFTTTADGTVSGGSVTVPATDNAVGSQGNTAAGSQLTLANAISGINSVGTAATDFTGGTDVQSNTLYRQLVLQIYQNPPQGGATADYETWALEVPGVTRAWPYANWMGNGTVGVLFMMDVAEAVNGGFPQGTNGGATGETRIAPATGDQLALANYIFPLRPVTAVVWAVAPTPQPINFTINGLTPNNATIQAGIASAISSCFVRNGVPGIAAGTTTFPLADIEAAIIAVPGIENFVITSPPGNISITAGGLPVLGTITYT